ncbi:hypothetical protein EYF80_066273 [Liparis tanakae]|uniref:Uncharacterized protein n=1 Tax=Liparis tanakae TaxID=230148 RepID=A0A4Z2E477_9TELE|nr:hypothetical protein EYF80_066273 [Liparis tanakae]
MKRHPDHVHNARASSPFLPIQTPVSLLTTYGENDVFPARLTSCLLPQTTLPCCGASRRESASSNTWAIRDQSTPSSSTRLNSWR